MISDVTLVQEIEVMYIIPTIRRFLAIYMKTLGKTQKRIAALLGIRESTVSQYINEKRGCKITLRESTLETIKQSAEKINEKFDTIREIQLILKKIRSSDEICAIHKQVSNMPDDCDPVELGCIHSQDLYEVHSK